MRIATRNQSLWAVLLVGACQANSSADHDSAPTTRAAIHTGNTDEAARVPGVEPTPPVAEPGAPTAEQREQSAPPTDAQHAAPSDQPRVDTKPPAALAPAAAAGSCSTAPVATCAASESAQGKLRSQILGATEACSKSRCGEFAVDIDANGCAVRLLLGELEQRDEFSQCVLRALGSARYPCAAGSRQTSTTSCTVL